MIRERVTITIQRDRKGCASYARVGSETEVECNRRLYVIGWRVSRDKHLCPEHAEQESRRLVRRGRCNSKKGGNQDANSNEHHP